MALRAVFITRVSGVIVIKVISTRSTVIFLFRASEARREVTFLTVRVSYCWIYSGIWIRVRGFKVAWRTILNTFSSLIVCYKRRVTLFTITWKRVAPGAAFLTRFNWSRIFIVIKTLRNRINIYTSFFE